MTFLYGKVLKKKKRYISAGRTEAEAHVDYDNLQFLPTEVNLIS